MEKNEEKGQDIYGGEGQAKGNRDKNGSAKR